MRTSLRTDYSFKRATSANRSAYVGVICVAKSQNISDITDFCKTFYHCSVIFPAALASVSKLRLRAALGDIPSLSSTSSSQRIDRNSIPWHRNMQGWKRPCYRTLVTPHVASTLPMKQLHDPAAFADKDGTLSIGRVQIHTAGLPHIPLTPIHISVGCRAITIRLFSFRLNMTFF